jgi:DNA-binding transcriptional regulator GbsR (MarR family)
MEAETPSGFVSSCATIEGLDQPTSRYLSLGKERGRLGVLTVAANRVKYVQYQLNVAMPSSPQTARSTRRANLSSAKLPASTTGSAAAPAARSATDWSATRRKFIEAGGQTTQSFGMGRILGQIYALLYLSPHALCLDEIAQELGVSKASVSTIVRQLVAWSAVRHVWVKGDRKDYYEAETDFGAILKNGVLEVARKKLNTAGIKIEEVEAALGRAESAKDGEGNAERQLIAERFQKAKDLHARLNELLNSPLLEQLV